MPNQLVAPDGLFIHYALTECLSHNDLNQVLGDCTTEVALQTSTSSEIEPSLYIANDGDTFVQTMDCMEWLLSQCRLVVCDFELHETEDLSVPAWPGEIQELCRRQTRLKDAMRMTKRAIHQLPDGWTDSTTMAALNTLVIGRIEAELGSIQARLDEFRKDEPPFLTEEDFEVDDAEA